MQTRRDHVQAYQFAMGRLATAFVSGDPGRGESPTKRASLGTYFGVLIVLLLCAGFTLYGVISPQKHNTWRHPGALLVEKETGNRFLYAGGKLRPVRNFASALLFTGAETAPSVVPREDLEKIPRGNPVGIEGAPDAVPTPAALLDGAWTRCLRPGDRAEEVVDFDPAGRTSAFPAGRQVLLLAGDGTRYVLFDGVKYPVPSQSALIALGLDADTPVRAPDDWLAAVPTGARLAPAAVAHQGDAAPKVAGRPTTVGQVFQTSGAGGTRTYLMTASGTVPIDGTEAALEATRPGAPALRRVTVADIAAAPVATGPGPDDHLPDVLGMPAVATHGAVVCLLQASTERGLTSRPVVEAGPAAAGGRNVLIPPARGVLASDYEQVRRQVASPARWLITDDGTAYRLDDQSEQALGLQSGASLSLPEDLLKLLPQGPALHRSAVLDAAAAGS